MEVLQDLGGHQECYFCRHSQTSLEYLLKAEGQALCYLGLRAQASWCCLPSSIQQGVLPRSVLLPSSRHLAGAWEALLRTFSLSGKFSN